MADAEENVNMGQADLEMDNADGFDDEEVAATQDIGQDDEPVAVNPQSQFLSMLRSPIIHLNIGSGAESTTISAHKAILTSSPFFSARLTEDATMTIDLPHEDLDAMGCFLQYQYTGEYFPRRLASQPDGLETDSSIPAIDSTGAQLLKHARVYTLAEKLGLAGLKTLAHSKIHRINSTAVGEIAYARYVYGHTNEDDITIRKPVAAFWATRSHVLRHEAEGEFKKMCLEFPQFGFDVLNLVLDAREKRQRERDDESGVSGTPATAGKGRKRMRPSVNV